MNITELKILGQNCVNSIDALKKHTWVTTESELSRKMQNLKAADFPLLVIVTPSFDGQGTDNDDFRNISQHLFFVLSKGGFQSEKESTIEADMDNTLVIIRYIQRFLLNGFPGVDECVTPNLIIPNSFHIDPEYNFLGANGWSMNFQMKY